MTAVAADPRPLAVGDVVDLTFRFGRQVRYKCPNPACRCYVSVADRGYGQCSRCGNIYTRQIGATDGIFIVTAVSQQ